MARLGRPMLILPAIDLRAGRCVRLRQGRYDQETVFDEDPVAVARRFEAAGAKWLHVVDLDGARAGEPKNLDTVRRIVEAAGMQVEVGGGIRTTQAAGDILAMGAARIIVGTRAIRESEWLKELADKFPRQVALGLDARGAGAVAVQGWTEKTDLMAGDVFDAVRGLALAAIVYTDIARDGMMSGPNVAATKALVQVCPFDLIASGGVTTAEDIERLKETGVAGAIIGRALYEGTITLEAALEAAGK
ncbi:MAG: 1-(5-phosphoribosyl)-5-[(5-phosphoribosylamino)methylideneamino]imidazole-4-carboxamide isomerase [Planctomycetota bacterium]|nr:1-(5-phosphoribosyl)-5-[(5-phosphoribosylamino)methylideneamino]imidazole-4-carboxamide isomerase [Planctomycetota bacterium]